MNLIKYHIVILSFLVLFIGAGEGAPKRIWSTYIAPMGPIGADRHEKGRLDCAADTVFAASQRARLAALDAKTGKIRWKIKLTAVPNGLVADGDAVYLGLEDGSFRAYDAKNGQEKWSMELKSAIVSRPALWNGMVYFLTGDETIHAVDAATGKWKWRYKRDTRKKMTILGLPAPVISDGVVFEGTGDGAVVALDALTGKLLWGKKPMRGAHARFEDADATPLVTEKTVVMAIYDGKVYSIDRETGSIKWEFDAGGSIMPISESAGLIIISGRDNAVHALNPLNGRAEWSYGVRGDEVELTGAIGHDDRVLFGSSWGRVYVLDARSGDVIEKFHTWGGVYSTPAICDGVAYVLNGRGQVEAISLE